MEDDWDLQAVVRGCATASAASVAPSDHRLFSADFQQDFTAPAFFQDLFEPRKDCFFEEDLHNLYKPFFPSSQPPAAVCSKSLPISPLSVLGGFRDPSSERLVITQQSLQQTQITQKKQPSSVDNSSKTSVSHNPSPRSAKRRKNNLKRICHVPADSLSSDMWSWRKYGQKPIKGSPYPRGYYKCSTLKGCMARKQVERNRSDPGMFILTYTGEHNHPMPTHRNSLAGCTRQKQAPSNPAIENPEKPTRSPETSPAPEKLESSPEDFAEDDDLSLADMAMDDDFLTGLEDFVGTDSGNDSFSKNLQFRWVVGSAKSTANDGG